MEGKKIRKWIVFTVLLSVMILLGLTGESNATYVTDSNGIQWNATLNSNKTATNVYYYSGTVPDGKLEIPSKLVYNDVEYTVTVITGRSNSSPICSAAGVTEVVVPDTVTTINGGAFYNMTALKKITIPSSVTTIGYAYYCFRYCSSLETAVISGNVPVSSWIYLYNNAGNLKDVSVAEGTKTQSTVIDGILYNVEETKLYKVPKQMACDNLVLPSTVTSIESNAFDNTQKIKSITFNEGLLSIGNYAFNSAKLSGELKLPSTLTSIGQYAFQYCSAITGDLIIPDSVQTIGSYAFYNCSGLDGELIVGDGITRLNSSTFNGCRGFKRVTIGSGVTQIDYGNFSDLDDLWVKSPKGQIYFADGYCSGKMPYVHFQNDTHNVVIGSLPGIKVINTTTGEEVTSGAYECETEFKYKIEIAPGYNYPNLKIVEINNNDYENYKITNFEKDKEYDFSCLLRDRKILIQNIVDGVDLSLRTFITDVNRISVSKPRIPEVDFGANGIEYRHTKNPVKVYTGDNVSYKIRVYNEGIVATTCGEVSVHIPEGMSFVEGNITNEKYGWTLENGVYKSTYLANQTLGLNIGNGILKYKDIEIVLRVDEESYESDVLKTVFAEISRLDEKDLDSTPGNVQVSKDYKKDEIYNSNSGTYIRGQEDDDDFETVVLNAKIKVEYNVRLRKIDSDTQESLKGAQFNLLSSGDNVFGFRRIDANGKEYVEIKEIKDQEIIATATSDENGVVDFGGIMTFDEGSDCFTYEEVNAPIGYLTNVGRKTRVRVDKKIIDREKGTYTVKVYCEAEAVTVDTDSYEYTPVTNAEQLKKIGSGEDIVIDGISYEYNIDTNYKLMNDIDLSGIDWKPLNNELKCIIDGNGHTIKNLTIKSTDPMKIAEVGFARVFSGIVKNLTFENPVIEITTFEDNAESLLGVSGVGVFAGVMKQGYIQNCKIIGNSAKVEATADNVGGFVGHTMEDGVLTITNSENNANVIGHSYVGENSIVYAGKNVGGFVGCCKSSLEVVNSKNKGQIQAERFNAGGFAGYANSSDYADMEVLVGFDEDNKTIDFVVENTRTEGDYNLTLEIRDQKTGNLIGGATYEIDKVDDVIKTALIDTGSLKLFDKIIHYSGRDIYFLTEDENIDGYEKLNGIIKVEIERYWDFDDLEFKARANAELVSHKEYEQYSGERESDTRVDNGEAFDKGLIFTDVNIANVNWNIRKMKFDNCINEGKIIADDMNAAGLIGVAYCTVDIENSTNKGVITGGGKTAGIVAEIRSLNGKEVDNYTGASINIDNTENTIEYSKINNCTNDGKIETIETTWMNNYGTTGGIVADCKGNIRIEKSTNNAVVTSTGERKVGGILGQCWGSSIIDSCINNAEISTYSASNVSYSSRTQNVAGGIIAQAMFNEKNVEKLLYEDISTKVTNCKNYGDVKSVGKLGGIMGQAYGKEVIITDCEIKGLDSNNKLQLNALVQGECGGVIGFSTTAEIDLSNNKIENVNLENLNTTFSSTTSSTIGGVLGGIDGNRSTVSYILVDQSKDVAVKKINISNNKVISCDLTNRSKEISGIWGIGTYIEKSDIKINDCLVDNCKIKEINPNNSTYNAASGIFSGGYNLNNVNISYCVVKNSSIEIEGVDGNLGAQQATAAGIFARCEYMYGDMTVSDCSVLDSKIRTHVQNGTSGNTGGIVGTIGNLYGNFKLLRSNIERSDVIDYACNVAGIVGGLRECRGSEGVIIEDCNNIECNVIRDCPNPYAIGTTYDKVAGIASFFNNVSNGVKISNCNVIGKETTDESQRNVIKSYYGAVAGVYGWEMSTNSMELTNITVKNIDMIMLGKDDILGCSYADLGGINALGMSKTNYKNMLVENCNIEAGYAKNVAGISGWDYSNSVFDNCDVKNVNISNYVGLDRTANSWSTYGNAAGLVCSLNSNSEFKNCDVTDCTVKSAAIGAGGAVYWSCGELKASNCTVTNIKLIDSWEFDNEVKVNSYQSYRPFAGFIANSSNNIWLDNIKVTNMECINAKYAHIGGIFGYISTAKQITNCSVEKGNFETSKCVDTTNGSVGGMGADLCYLDGKCSDNKVKDVTISTGVHLAGGLFGYANGSGKSIERCEVDNVNITHRNELYNTNGSSYESLPSAGGLASVISSDLGIKDCVVKNSEILALATCARPLQVGGILGCSQNNVTIDNTKVIKTNIENRAQNSFTGGLVGYIYEYPSSTVIPTLTITNSSVEQDCVIKGVSHVGGAVGQATLIGTNVKVKDTTIECNNDGSSQMAGLITIAQPNSVLNNAIVEDTTITDINTETTNSYLHAGGISAVFKGKIESATVTNVDITANGSVGGIAGICESQTAKNAKVIGGTMTSRLAHAGGACGVNKTLIEDSSVTNTKVIANSCAGGFAGVSDGAFKNDTVTGATVTSKTSHAGGLVACTTKDIDNCSVTGTTVKLETMNDLNCVGGLVGAGSGSAPAMTNVISKDNTLTGGILFDETWVNNGKYIGAPTAINNSLVNAEISSLFSSKSENEVVIPAISDSTEAVNNNEEVQNIVEESNDVQEEKEVETTIEENKVDEIEKNEEVEVSTEIKEDVVLDKENNSQEQQENTEKVQEETKEESKEEVQEETKEEIKEKSKEDSKEVEIIKENVIAEEEKNSEIENLEEIADKDTKETI